MCVLAGVNVMLRKIAVAAASKPSVEITQDGEDLSIKTSTSVRTTHVTFTVGHEFNETTVDGRPCTVNTSKKQDVMRCVCHFNIWCGFKHTQHLRGAIRLETHPASTYLISILMGTDRFHSFLSQTRSEKAKKIIIFYTTPNLAFTRLSLCFSELSSLGDGQQDQLRADSTKGRGAENLMDQRANQWRRTDSGERFTIFGTWYIWLICINCTPCVCSTSKVLWSYFFS